MKACRLVSGDQILNLGRVETVVSVEPHEVGAGMVKVDLADGSYLACDANAEIEMVRARPGAKFVDEPDDPTWEAWPS